MAIGSLELDARGLAADDWAIVVSLRRSLKINAINGPRLQAWR
jgi:hypothetical protein